MPFLKAFFNNLAGDNSEEATPDPIPNSEVKLFSVDGTAWVTMWESRESPAFFFRGLRAARSPTVMFRRPFRALFLSIHAKTKKRLDDFGYLELQFL